MQLDAELPGRALDALPGFICSSIVKLAIQDALLLTLKLVISQNVGYVLPGTPLVCQYSGSA